MGSAKDIADQLEQWFVERACDGFVVAATHLPRAFEDFVRLMIPELQRRGSYHREYEGLTLRETSACRSRVGGSSRRGNFLPSARLFLQKGGNGPRTGGQHSFWARETKPFPEGFFFVASTEPPALLEKRNHLIHKGLKTLGINVYDRLVAQWKEWDATMMPLDPQSFTAGFTGAQLADHFGIKPESRPETVGALPQPAR